MRSFNKYHFKGQKEGERIISVIHRHWFDILVQFSIVLVLLFLFIGSYILVPILFTDINETLGINFLHFMENLFLIFIWMTFFVIWIDFYFDVWIITNERIVNINQKGLFSRVVSELELENIQDITTEVYGMIPTFFNYGNLYVQTAAERERFLFRNVPDPYRIKDEIMNLQNEFEKQEGRELGNLIHKQIHE
jgi:hypothetical protein